MLVILLGERGNLKLKIKNAKLKSENAKMRSQSEKEKLETKSQSFTNYINMTKNGEIYCYDV